MHDLSLAPAAFAQVDTTTPLPDLLEATEWSTFEDAELENPIRYIRGCTDLRIPGDFRKCLPEALNFAPKSSVQPVPIFE